MIQTQVINYTLSKRDPYFVKNFDVSYFSDYPKEFEFLANHYRKYNEIPSEATFLEAFDDFDVIIYNHNRQSLIDELIADKQKLDVIKSYKKMVDLFNSGKSLQEEMDDIGAEIISLNNKFNNSSPKKSLNKFDDLLINIFEEREHNYSKHFYDTGFRWLNEVCYGWDKDTDYVTIAGRPGTGKSMMLCRLAAEQLKRGKVVDYYSGEMPTIQVVERIVSALTGISATAIFKADPTIKSQYYNFIKNELPKYKLNVITPQELGGKYARASQLESFAVDDKADILFIDQQSLMEDEDKAKIAFERAANISRQIKAMRDRLNIPVITAVQLNRTKLDNGESDTVQIAGSDVIAQDSTKVILLKETAKGSGEIELNIIKNRNGKSYQSHNFISKFETCDFIDAEEVAKPETMFAGTEINNNDNEGNYF